MASIYCSSFSLLRRQGCGAIRISTRRQRPRNALTRRFIWTVHSDTGVVSHNQKACFQTIIGLEIHAQLDIPTKLFSRAKASASLAQAPNTLVHPFDLAVPGTLPMTSRSAVQAAILTAAALNCTVAPTSRFERKHYHYADLPFGYQVTQQRWPIARDGSLKVMASANSKAKKKKKNSQESIMVGIDRIQLEQDTGKTTTITTTTDKTTITKSLIDFNRAGCALVEIVMNPDLRSSKHAAATVETLRQLLRHIGTCNGRMEEGSLRVDLNVSIQPIINDDDNYQYHFQPNMSNRVEVKNLNSLRQVQQAAEYEAIRQAKLLSEDAELTFQETRTYNIKSGKTVLIRTKEGEEDYRFMPEPDLPPVVLNEQVLGVNNTLEDFLAQKLPELPEAARQRLSRDYQLDEYTATVIASDPPAIQIYDDAVQACKDNLLSTADDDEQLLQQKEIPNEVAKMLINDLFSHIREEEEHQREIEQLTGAASGGTSASDAGSYYSTVNGQQLGELVSILLQGTISKTMAKNLLKILFYEKEYMGASPKQVAQERGIQLISDPAQLRVICEETIHQYPDKLEQYRKGGKHVVKMKKFLVGKAMAHSEGNAHPERLHEALEDVLEELAPGVQ